MKNQQILGETTAKLMDLLDEEDEENGEISECIIIVRVDVPANDEEGEGSYIRWRSSSYKWSHQLGLLHGAIEGMQTTRLVDTLLQELKGDD